MFYVQIGDLRHIEGFSHLRDIIPHLGTMSLVMPWREFSSGEMARQLDH